MNIPQVDPIDPTQAEHELDIRQIPGITGTRAVFQRQASGATKKATRPTTPTNPVPTATPSPTDY